MRDAVNIDLAPLRGVDAAANLDKGLPFKDASFDEVICIDVLEHVESLTQALREIHRILRPGGVTRIRSCHFSSRYLWEDPTHRRGFSFLTLDYYCRHGAHSERDYYFDFAFSRVLEVRVDLPHERGFPWSRTIERLLNRDRRILSYYELGFLRSIFPAANVNWVLEK